MDIFYPIQLFADLVTYEWLGIMHDSYLGNAVNFFIYDLIKIGLMLVIINYLMAIIRYYLPVTKVKNLLSKKRFSKISYLLAALLGVVTPFCSCSSIPLFIGFLSAGIPMGVVFTFLISSPLVNEASLYLFPTIFGLKITIIYNLVGIIISILGGILIEKLNMQKFIKTEFLQFESKKITKNKEFKIPIFLLLKYWFKKSMTISKQIFPYVILGVTLGALIHGLIPETLLLKYLAIKSWWVIPLATLMGVPLYANSVSVIPIVEALVSKGAAMGSALAFMTATITLSIPEALILKKVMRWQLLFSFFAITIVGIMLIGFIFNWLV